MSFDFDRVIERRGTHSAKWDLIARLSGITAPDALAMWVADMDFQAPPGVTAALQEEVQRGTHGYYANTGSWAEALADWMGRRHALKVDPAWVSPMPGVVAALALIIQRFTAPGDEVVIFPPVYHVFRKVIAQNGRSILDVELVERSGRYHMDFELLGEKITPRTRAVLFCNPHNPGGTVWTAEEVRALARVCIERDLLLISDEIHCDLLLDGVKYAPALAAAPEAADRLITCVAATKTFNLAGAHVGACITSSPALKRRLDAAIDAGGLNSMNSFGMIATEAAWRTGGAWLDALLVYLAENRDLFDRRIQSVAPGARSMRLASTYLAWVDFAGTGLSPAEVEARIRERARIFASPGAQFGPGGTTSMRFNIATPRPLLREALDRLEDAFGDLRKG